MLLPTWKMREGVLWNECAIFQHLAQVDVACFHNQEKPGHSDPLLWLPCCNFCNAFFNQSRDHMKDSHKRSIFWAILHTFKAHLVLGLDQMETRAEGSSATIIILSLPWLWLPTPIEDFYFTWNIPYHSNRNVDLKHNSQDVIYIEYFCIFSMVCLVNRITLLMTVLFFGNETSLGVHVTKI